MSVKVLVTLVMTHGLVQALEIESLAVPPVLVSGDSAVMSCYYSLPDTRLSELDIKWYHGASPSPFIVRIYFTYFFFSSLNFSSMIRFSSHITGPRRTFLTQP